MTPFRLGTIDQRQLATLVDRQVLSGIDGLVVCDGVSEGSSLSEHERDDVIWDTVAATRNRIPVIAATGTNCTSRTIDLTLRAAELGAKAALVTVPYYSKPGDRGIIYHFQQIERTGQQRRSRVILHCWLPDIVVVVGYQCPAEAFHFAMRVHSPGVKNLQKSGNAPANSAVPISGL